MRNGRFPRLIRGCLLLLALAVSLVACGRSRATPTPTSEPPTPTSEPQRLAQLTGVDLLSVGPIACDHPEDATLECSGDREQQRLRVQIHAGTFARWSLHLPPVEQPLTGNETLALRLRRTGEVTPNLYVVEAEGRRVLVNLARYGLRDEWRTLHVPLREIRDEEGNRPDFSRIVELQVVFEWAEMAGELSIDAVRFDPVWQEEAAIPDLPAGVTVPDGFVIEPVAGDIHNPTQIETPAPGELLVSEQAGRIWWYTDTDGDGRYETRRLYDSGYTEIVGLLHDPVDGAVWLGGRGQLWRTRDRDGDGAADTRELRIDGLVWGRHQNNGLAWNPVADPFTGEPPYTWIYFGLGSTEDLEVGGEYNASVLRFPRDGEGQEGLEVVSRGNRNTYDVVWAPVATADGVVWSLFASENGPDFNDAPDEVNHIRRGRHYGFPEQFGPVEPESAEGEPYSSPVYPVAAHASADGLAYVANPGWPAPYRTLYVALFGEVFSEDRVGHTVDRVTLTPVETVAGPTFRGEPSVFIRGLDRPLALTTDPAGDLLAADYATGIVYRVRYTGE